MKKVFAVLAALIFLAMTSCSGGDSSSTNESKDTDSISSNISTSGGEVTTPSGDAGLSVPAGAVSGNKSITVSLSNKVTPPGNVGSSYEFTSDGQTFASPVTISIKYDPASIPAGVNPSKLKLARLSDNGVWEIIEESTVDTVNHIVSGPTNHFSIYTIVVNERKDFGEQTGELNSVIAYSNGTTENISNEYNSYSGYNTGMKWLCDEYVNRYYKQVYDKQIRIEGRKANDYYQNAAARGLVAYPNDGSVQPQAGDILVSEYGEYGHVAIVCEVQDNKIFVIQQNWSDNGADERYPITRDGSHVYPFDGKKGNYEVKGWLRANTDSIIYSISGNITLESAGLSGVTVTLAGASSASTTTDASGNYSFNSAVNGDYTITPSNAGYSFSLTSINITVNNADITGQNFTATANTYTIYGTVSGDVVAGVTITLTGTGSSSTVTDSSGHYSFNGASNGSYTITASMTGYIFSPASISATVNNANLSGQNFTATANTYSISGTVSGAVVSGVTITLTGTGFSSTTTDSSGNYSFSGAQNGNYTITPSMPGYIFCPKRISATVSNSNVAGQNFIAMAKIIPTSGLVAYYPFNGNANDESGNGHNGTIIGNVIFDIDRFGVPSSAANFEGSGNKILIPHESSLNSSEGTWSSWVKFTQTGIWGSVIHKDTYGSTQDGHLEIMPDMSVQWYIEDSSGEPEFAISAAGTVTQNQWIHIVATWGTNGMKVYVNGSLVAEKSYTGSINSPGNLTIGCNFDTGDSIQGLVDDVRIYNHALSECEINQLYNAETAAYTISGKVSGDVVSGVKITLTGTGSSSTTTDASGNYSFSGAVNGSYILSPSMTGYTFSPISSNITVYNAALTGQNFTATTSTTPTSGLVAYYPFNGNVIDVSGNGNHGVNHGTTATTDRHGNASGALYFHSSAHDHVDVSAIASSLASYGTGTISLWFKAQTNPLSAGAPLIFFGNGFFYIGEVTSELSGESIGLTPNTGYVLNGYENGNAFYVDNTWHHAVVVMGTDFNAIYVDDIQLSLRYTHGDASTGNCMWTPITQVIIGSRQPALDDFTYEGSLDDVRIYNRALSASEIAQLYSE
jgi:hypothetical protein